MPLELVCYEIPKFLYFEIYSFCWVFGDILAIPPCEGILDAPFGRITSPGYPDVYPHELHCEWSIRRPEHDSIYIYFNDFQLTEYYSDYLKVCYVYCAEQNN